MLNEQLLFIKLNVLAFLISPGHYDDLSHYLHSFANIPLSTAVPDCDLVANSFLSIVVYGTAPDLKSCSHLLQLLSPQGKSFLSLITRVYLFHNSLIETTTQ